MSLNAWLTVDEIPAARTTRTITVPDDETWLAILRGCLYLLTVEENYELFGTLTPAEMADEWRAIFFSFMEDLPVLIPPGLISPFAGSSAPAGWLLCNGSAVSRTTYAELFAAIGASYGAGDGATTFNLPDCRGRFLFGLDPNDSPYNALNYKAGAHTVTLALDEIPSHTHVQNPHTHVQNSHGHNLGGQSSFGSTFVNSSNYFAKTDNDVEYGPEAVTAATATNQNATATNQNAGGGGSHPNMPPFVTTNYIIKT